MHIYFLTSKYNNDMDFPYITFRLTKPHVKPNENAQKTTFIKYLQRKCTEKKL